MKVLAVIPARYASTRFPGKPLALLGGKPIIQWVWEKVSEMKGITDGVVATDDMRIVQAVKQFGGQVLMTSDQHRSGTDRCGEVLTTMESQGQRYDIVINVQGDEPFVQEEQLQCLIDCFSDPATQIATLRKRITNQEELLSPNNVKVIGTENGRAIYFSRQPLPYLRGVEIEKWIERQDYYKHIGIYAFRSETLHSVVKLQQSPLEKSESLEQLRWLENGYDIRLCDTQIENIGIDTPEDLNKAEESLRQ